MNGDLVPAKEATVSVCDRGFQYGDAAFETLRAYGGDVFEWRAHVARLERTCETLGIDHGLSDGDLRVRVQEVLDANGLTDAYVRLSVTRGIQPGKLTPSEDVDPTVVVVAKELPRGGVEGTSAWDGPADVQTATIRKPPDESLPADAKTHNYLNGILARRELVDADEALLRDVEGDVAEGATSNLFFVDDEGLHTPSEDLPILPGVTRSVVANLVEAETDIPLHAGRYRPEDVRNAEEAFLTNTTWEIRPVGTVDGIDVGGGPVTRLLSTLFDKLVERRHY